MGLITLAGGHVALVDDADVPLVSAHRWSLHTGGYAMSAVRSGGSRRTIYMHRLIVGAPPGRERGDWIEVDHINGQKLDNRRANLRLARRRDNVVNKLSPNRRSGKFRGVERTRGGLWRARIYRNGCLHHIGVFDTAENAARAYDAAAQTYFGCFAQLNFGDKA